MFPGYASRLYNEMENLYQEKTLKIKPAKSDNGEKTSKSESTKSDNGPKTSKIEPTKSDNGPKTLKNKSNKSDKGEKILKIKPAKSDNGEKTSESESTKGDNGEKKSKKNKNKVINIIDSARRKYSVFIGATVLAQTYNNVKGEISGYWITKQDWEEVGPNIVLKKCQNIMA